MQQGNTNIDELNSLNSEKVTLWLALLKLLSSYKFTSGQILSDQLNISRSVLWKLVGELKEQGFEIDAVKNRGYLLRSEISLLDKDAITNHLRNFQINENDLNIEILPECASTNSYLLSRPLHQPSSFNNKAKIEICLAESQTNGRARQGKRWIAPFASSIILSIKYPVLGGFFDLSGLSLIIGLSGVRALEALGLNNVEIKWPNDLYVQGKKLAGILIELQSNQTINEIVIGIGLNVDHRLSLDTITKTIVNSESYPFIDLKTIQPKLWCRNEIAAQLVKSILQDMQNFQINGFHSFKDAYQKVDFLNGKNILATISNELEIQGTCLGVNEKGSLIIKDNSGEIHTVISASVRLV